MKQDLIERTHCRNLVSVRNVILETHCGSFHVNFAIIFCDIQLRLSYCFIGMSWEYYHGCYDIGLFLIIMLWGGYERYEQKSFDITNN